MSKLKTARLLATAIGALLVSNAFAGADMPANDKSEGTVKCTGINSCKGSSACKTATNSCKGQNACKGMGMTMVASEDDCGKKGGKVMKDDSAAMPASTDTATGAPQ